MQRKLLHFIDCDYNKMSFLFERATVLKYAKKDKCNMKVYIGQIWSLKAIPWTQTWQIVLRNTFTTLQWWGFPTPSDLYFKAMPFADQWLPVWKDVWLCNAPKRAYKYSKSSVTARHRPPISPLTHSIPMRAIHTNTLSFQDKLFVFLRLSTFVLVCVEWWGKGWKNYAIRLERFCTWSPSQTKWAVDATLAELEKASSYRVAIRSPRRCV